MTSIAGDILKNLRDTLRAASVFESVSLGADADSAACPRAEVTLTGVEELAPEGLADGAYRRLKAAVRVLARAAAPGEALTRALALAETARAAVLVDPFRGDRCADLPIGRATECGPLRPEPHVKPPTAAVTFEVRCHFEDASESPLTGSSFAGADLFSSGPHEFRPLAWSRGVQRRSFAGVDGELVLDLGIRSREVLQTGRLHADSDAALTALIAAIEAAADGQPHALADNRGQTYPRAILERFQLAGPRRQSRGVVCDYEITYRQLP